MRRSLVAGLLLASLVTFIVPNPPVLVAAPERGTLYWGTRGSDVRWMQSRLRDWGYYRGPIDGIFGPRTAAAVRLFQRRNGLRVDGLVGRQTWAALGRPLPPPARRAAAPARGRARSTDVELLARTVSAEARGESYEGQVAVAAVILNRVGDSRFPNSLSGVIYQPLAFESVANGEIYRRPPSASSRRAARAALNGWDPTGGAVFFWNPAKPVSRWIWSRPIIKRIGNHVFAR